MFSFALLCFFNIQVLHIAWCFIRSAEEEGTWQWTKENSPAGTKLST